MDLHRGCPLFYEIVRYVGMTLYLHRKFLTMDSDSAIRAPLSHLF